ncbi:hypothetical protein NBRC116589_24030 [Ruegeria sp. HU-ET01832]
MDLLGGNALAFQVSLHVAHETDWYTQKVMRVRFFDQSTKQRSGDASPGIVFVAIDISSCRSANG